MENGLTASDVALMQRDTRCGWGDSSFMWVFALLILLFGGNGFGFGNGASLLTQSDLQRAIDLNSIQNGQRDIEARVQEIGSELTGTIKDSAYNNLSEIRDVEQTVNAGFAAMQKANCDTQRAIDSVNYNIAKSTADINTVSTTNMQKVLDAITANKIASLEGKINSLELQQAMAGVVRYPAQTTYTSGANPFCSGCCNV